MNRIFCLCIVLLSTTVIALPGSAQGQKDPAGPFEELVEVTEVFLDVMATDKKGHPIPGLGKDDFIIEEGGQPVEITSASYYTTRYGHDPAPSTAPEVPASRYFILFFDDQKRGATQLNRLMARQIQASRKAHDWVRDHLSGSDWVAVVSYDVKLKIHQDFTQDTGSLLAAISDATTAKEPGVLKPSERKRLTGDATPSLWRRLPTDANLRPKTKQIYQAIRLIAEASRPLVGRKNLLLFTTGFGDIEIGIDPTARPDPHLYPSMEQALNDSNVAVYPIDLMPAHLTHLQVTFLTKLAVDTGGSYFRNVANFMAPLERIDRESAGYYLLSFRAEHPSGRSGYRQIKVQVRDRGIKIRARRGYKYGLGN